MLCYEVFSLPLSFGMFRQIAYIIPASFRRRSVTAAVTILLRAVLNFFGIALLVPLLMLILDGDAIHSHHVLQRVYEALGFTDDNHFIVTVAAGVVAAIIVKGAADMLLYRSERDYIFGLYRNLSRRLYIDYHRRGLEFVLRNNSSELSRNVNIVCLNFVVGVLRPIAVIAGEALLFLLIIVVLAVFQPLTAAALVAILAPAVWLYYRIIRRRMENYGKQENEAQRAKFRNVAESFRGYADVEINNAFPRMLSAFDEATERVIAMRKRDASLALLPQIFTETAIAAGMAAMVVASVYVSGGSIRLLFGLFAVAAVRLMPSVRNILSAYTSLRYNRYTLDILARVGGDERVENDDRRLPMHSSLELRDVTFGYDDGAKENVICGFSLKVARGEKIGIRGSSGAGKSTLMNIMLGLYVPQRGEVLVDGLRLDAANRRMWQNSVGYVPQSVFILDATLAENVALGDDAEHIDRERVMRSLEMASLGSFAGSLPDGIDTMIGEGGSRVSGGERQRIGIARALYRNPDVLFFDEATSALDRDTERSVNESIARLSADNHDLTIVVIAHRETSLAYCDRIIDI